MSSVSTTYFPGAPVNAEPLTTMATSTSDTVTSHSSAATVPTTSDVAPTTSAGPEEARASSSASNPADKEKDKDKDKPPGSADPSVTATTSSETSTTTTTNTTAGGATTTTTTATGTMASTGRMSPTIPLQVQFHDAIARCNNCLFLIRKLRAKQNSITEMFLYSEVPDSESYQAYLNFGFLMQEMMDMYNKLDYYSKRLPKVVPPIDNINVMRTLYSQEHTMAHTNINYLIEKMIDSGNWNEGNYQVFYYLSELLRVVGQRKRLIDFLAPKPLPEIEFKSSATSAHAAFETAYKQMKKEILNKSLGIYPKTLFASSTGLVIEFLFGSGGTKVITNYDVVLTMKFLIVERNGHVEYINMVAPHEEWVKYNNFSQITINPFMPSRYEVYRRLTKQANFNLSNCFGQHQSRWTAHNLITFVSLFGRFREVFNTKCRACKQVTKHFMPPSIFDIRTPNIAYHDNCR